MIKKIIKQLYEWQFPVNPLEEYYNNKYMKTDTTYHGRYGVDIDVRNFFNSHDSEVRKVVTKIRSDTEFNSDDQKAWNCLLWVIENMKYTKDNENGRNEYWQFAYESLKRKTGDCEDGAILLANLMLQSGIPYWKIRLVAGNVKGGGHAYLTYYCEFTSKWVILDWCYWPNLKHIHERPDYKDEKNYHGVWFSWNVKYCWRGKNA